MKKIIHVFDVKSSRDRVYEALTTQRGLAGWWTTGKGLPYGAS